MIRLNCVKCRAVLELDDAFAGGTCRCSRCGTIQTVPTGTPTVARSPVPQPKAIYQHRAQRGASGGSASAPSGLDELADAVLSSGLSAGNQSGGRSSRGGRPTGANPSKHPSRATIIAVAVGSTVVLLVAAILFWPQTENLPPSTVPEGRARQTVSTTPEASVVENRSILGIPLTTPTVAYVVDRGASSRETFGATIELLDRSIASLASDQRFAVILWDNGIATEGLPDRLVSPAERSTVVEALRGAVVVGQPDPDSAVRQAAEIGAQTIVLISPKGSILEFDDELLPRLLALRRTAVIHTIDINQSSELFRTLADRTGGRHAVWTP